MDTRVQSSFTSANTERSRCPEYFSTGAGFNIRIRDKQYAVWFHEHAGCSSFRSTKGRKKSFWHGIHFSETSLGDWPTKWRTPLDVNRARVKIYLQQTKRLRTKQAKEQENNIVLKVTTQPESVNNNTWGKRGINIKKLAKQTAQDSQNSEFKNWIWGLKTLNII